MGKQRVTADTIDELKELAVGIVKSIVDHPTDVEVNIVPASYRLLAELHTNTDDVGQVVGRSGVVISALRTIFSAFAGKNSIHVDLEFVTEHEKAAARSGAR